MKLILVADALIPILFFLVYNTVSPIMIGALLDHISLKNLFSGLIIVYILFKITQWLNTERKIRALGGHAPRIPTYLPFGTISSLLSVL